MLDNPGQKQVKIMQKQTRIQIKNRRRMNFSQCKGHSLLLSRPMKFTLPHTDPFNSATEPRKKETGTTLIYITYCSIVNPNPDGVFCNFLQMGEGGISSPLEFTDVHICEFHISINVSYNFLHLLLTMIQKKVTGSLQK